jgi:hypothetical protein
LSLILDALRKLERDKQAGEPGVVVVGPVPWGERVRTRRWLVPGLAVLGGMCLAAVATWLLVRNPTPPRSPGGAEAHSAPPAASAPSPAPPARPAPVPDPGSGTVAVAPPPDRGLALPAAPPAAEPTHAPPVATPPAPAALELRLNAISEKDGRPVALINDHLVFEGDSFAGVRVVRIGETEVEVEVGGKRRVLRF